MKSKNPVGRPPVPLTVRFWNNVKTEGDFPDPEKYPEVIGRCWKWTGMKSQRYGKIFDRDSKKVVGAHRISWELHRGPIPKGMSVCHKCDNPECCNPDHLFIGTVLDNIQDKVRKVRHRRGEYSHNARLTPLAVRVARRLRGLGFTYRNIATVFGVSVGCSTSAVKRICWKHVV